MNAVSSRNEIARINYSELDKALQKLKVIVEPLLKRNKVLLISPYHEEYLTVKKHFPLSIFYASTKNNWNLNFIPPRNYQFDLIVASNVFMYAQNPQKWFDNILAHTRFLVFQDLIIRKRSATPPFLGDDQDCMRYSYSTKGINSDFAMAFDLSKLEPRILYFRSYEGGRNEFHSASRIAPLHFCSIVQGESNCTLREISPVGYWNLRATLFWINFKSYFKNILYSTRSDRSKGGST